MAAIIPILAHVAQLVEHIHGKDEVNGSSSFVSSRWKGPKTPRGSAAMDDPGMSHPVVLAGMSDLKRFAG